MNPPGVLRLEQLSRPDTLADLLARYRLQLVTVEPGQTIPGSFWGDEEAGHRDDRR